MTLRTLLWTLLIPALAVLVTACATPETRIRENLELFEGLPVAQQNLIREGRVGIGFTPDMVRLAVGDPDRVWRLTDTDGESLVWTYTTYETTAGVPLYRGWYHRYQRLDDGRYPYYRGERTRKAREVFKVTFRDGHVVLVEQDS